MVGATWMAAPDSCCWPPSAPATASPGCFPWTILTTGRPLSDEDGPSLVGFATALAIALENVTLHERLAGQIRSLGAEAVRSAGELSLIGEISRSIGGAQSLEAALDIVYDGIRAGLGYDRVGIHLVDPQSQLLTEFRGTDARGRKLSATGRSLSLAPDSSIWQAPSNGSLLRGALFYYTEDVYAETPPEQRESLDGVPRQNLTVALRNGEAVTGLIAVDNLISNRTISRGGRRPPTGPGGAGGDGDRASPAAGTRADRASAPGDPGGERPLAQLQPGQGCDPCRSGRAAAPDHRCRSCPVHPGGSHRPACRASGVQRSCARPAGGIQRRWSRRPTRRWLRCCRVADRSSGSCTIPAAGSLQPEEQRYLERRGLRAELLLPVVARGVLIGVLEVYWTRAVTIDADTVAWCEAIAGQAGVALHNARLYAEVALRAERDGLTNLLNHRALLEGIDLGRSWRSVHLLLLDLDNFKGLNDTYGHRVGDLVLLRVATLLRRAVRGWGGGRALRGRRVRAAAPAGRWAGRSVARALAEAVTVEPYHAHWGLRGRWAFP